MNSKGSVSYSRPKSDTLIVSRDFLARRRGVPERRKVLRGIYWLVLEIMPILSQRVVARMLREVLLEVRVFGGFLTDCIYIKFFLFPNKVTFLLLPYTLFPLY